MTIANLPSLPPRAAWAFYPGAYEIVSQASVSVELLQHEKGAGYLWRPTKPKIKDRADKWRSGNAACRSPDQGWLGGNVGDSGKASWRRLPLAWRARHDVLFRSPDRGHVLSQEGRFRGSPVRLVQPTFAIFWRFLSHTPHFRAVTQKKALKLSHPQ